MYDTTLQHIQRNMCSLVFTYYFADVSWTCLWDIQTFQKKNCTNQCYLSYFWVLYCSYVYTPFFIIVLPGYSCKVYMYITITAVVLQLRSFICPSIDSKFYFSLDQFPHLSVKSDVKQERFVFLIVLLYWIAWLVIIPEPLFHSNLFQNKTNDCDECAFKYFQ